MGTATGMSPTWMLLSLVRQETPARIDSIATIPELPSPALRTVRFLFNTVPQWVQIGGAILAMIVAVVLAVLAWRYRRGIVAWFGARSRAWKLGFAAGVIVVGTAAGVTGLSTWNYMMHDNEFCSGCHIMGEPFQRFGTSEHAQLGCHDCHRQSIFASAWELYVQVMERPTEIPAHRTVPNAICAECHIQRDPDSTWQRVSATAGHQVHLNPASPVMSQVQCTTCHGQEVHRFRPVSETCAQSGCHDDVRVELGRMAQQSDLHCTVCHEFTVPATEGVPVDSSRAAFSPTEQQCLGCHAMQEQLRSFKPENDPHQAKCGSCHDAHNQTTPAGAFQSCATSQCHARSDTLTAMHRNLGQHRLATCGACHGAHTWKADAVDCRSCHTGISDPAVRTRPPGAGPPAPMPHGPAPAPVTPASPVSPHALDPHLIPAIWSGSRQAGATLVSQPAGRERWRSANGFLALSEAPVPPVAAAGQGRDTTRFDHARHESVSCTTCHSTATGHGIVRTSARNCQGCHHADDRVGRDCARCHTPDEIAPARTVLATVSLTVWPEPRSRDLPFAHPRHEGVACATCHGTSIDRTPQRDCASCHADHHQAERNCATCHEPARASHPRELHATGCATSGCHASESTPAVTPVRNTCLACHGAQREHMPGRQCATCHLSAWAASP